MLLLSHNLIASNISAEEKIYTSILKALFPNNGKVIVWTDDNTKDAIFSHIKNSYVTQKREKANILFIFHTLNIDSKKPKFVGSYPLLKHYKKDAIGGFYWQKGRPNLIFLQENLKRKGLHVNGTLKHYVEDSF